MSQGQQFVIAIVVVNADPVFDRDRQWADLVHCGDAIRDDIRLGHQAGAEAAALHTVGGAAHVQVDLVVPVRLNNLGDLRQLRKRKALREVFIHMVQNGGDASGDVRAFAFEPVLACKTIGEASDEGGDQSAQLAINRRRVVDAGHIHYDATNPHQGLVVRMVDCALTVSFAVGKSIKNTIQLVGFEKQL
mgnify:CR=1 FL=1